MTQNPGPDGPERPEQHRTVVLLVDDQPLLSEAIERMLSKSGDITVHHCQQATEAVAMAAKLRPTVILQDLVMPDIDGLDLVSGFRSQEATRDTPLIVMSTREEAATKAEAFARGANDFLIKLPDAIELVARIRYHSGRYVALMERNEAYRALAASERALRVELAKAADYVRSLLPTRTQLPVWTDWCYIPSAALGGDAFDYQWLDDDHFAACLLDVCGHGIGSALLSVSVLNALRARTLPDTDFTDPSSVLAAVNRAFPMERQNFMFFTMWYGVFRRGERELTYASGGHPPAIIRPAGTTSAEHLNLLEGQGPLVGVDSNAEFPSSTCPIRATDHLYVYSDGVFELTWPDGREWSFGEFVKFMGMPGQQDALSVSQILHHARGLQARPDFKDDFSMLQLRFVS